MRRREPAVFAAAEQFLSASSYMVLRLTGESVMDYHTASYYNPLFALRGFRRDRRFAQTNLASHRLPRLPRPRVTRGPLPAAPGQAGNGPGTGTAVDGVVLAGAWTDTGWPATMEGAVRSGLRAAREAANDTAVVRPG